MISKVKHNSLPHPRGYDSRSHRLLQHLSWSKWPDHSIIDRGVQFLHIHLDALELATEGFIVASSTLRFEGPRSV